MKSPILHFPYDFRTEYEDEWRFGYSIFDKEHISIYMKDWVKRSRSKIDYYDACESDLNEQRDYDVAWRNVPTHLPSAH